ncbi:MAG: PEP-CTERM system TPR-repeat protein PrsT [Gammaproteobacteria bacterium]|nr:MAG: PEP-CTERM system TPR-repeat protein PrsT [Gammaproteobacteria bacterium]
MFLLFISFSLAASQEDKLYETARSALNDNKYNEALIHVKNILKTSPKHLASHILMAEILLANGSASAAEVALTKATTFGANKQQLQLLFAKSYIIQGQYNKTLNYLPEQTNDDKLAAKIYVLRGDAHLGLRQLKLSQNAYNIALTFDTRNIDAKLGLAQISVNYFQYHQADKLVDEVLVGYIPPIKAWNLKASIQQSLGNNELALKAVNQALLIDKNNIQSLIFASTINIELQQFALAEQYADMVLKQTPNEPKAEFLKAMVQVRKNKSSDLENSIEKVAQVLEHLSEDVLRSNPSYYYLASIILFHQQKYEAARQYIASYLFVDENNINALTLAATIELIEKKPMQAKVLLSRANFLEPNSPKILSMLGMTYLALKQYKKAHFHLAKVKELKPNLGIADTQLAQSYLATGQPEKAIEHLLTASAAEYDPTMVGLLLVESYIKSGEIDKGINVAKNLAKNMPSNANIQHHLGYIYQISGDIKQAKKQFEQALVIEPNHVKSVVSLANLDYKKGNVDAAINRLKTALIISVNDTSLITNLAKLYNRSNNSAASVILLEEQFKLDNKNEELLKSLIVSYVGNKQLISAIETLNTYLLNQRKTVDLYLILASLQTINSDVLSAVHAYKSAMKQGGDKGEIFLLIAQAYQRFSKVSEAIAAYKKAMAWDENNEKVIIRLAALYNAENNTASAIKLIKAFEANHQLSGQLVEVLANSYLRVKQYDLAEKYYNKRIKITSNSSSIVGLNLVYRATKRTNEAMTVLTKSLNKNPSSLLLNTALAELYIDQSQWLKADGIYQTLVTLHPKHPAILNNASYVALSLADYQRAEMLIKKSLAIVDNQPDSLDTLGWIYYHTKEFNEALPLFRKALAINNSNPAVKYHLALTLKALKRDKEAIKLMVDVVNSDYTQKVDADALLKQWLK